MSKTLIVFAAIILGLNADAVNVGSETVVSPHKPGISSGAVATPLKTDLEQTPQAEALRCLEDLRLLMGVLIPIEESAKARDHSERLACLQPKVQRLKGLLAVVESAWASIESFRPLDESALIEDELEKIAVACDRALVLSHEIEGCDPLVNLHEKEPPAQTVPESGVVIPQPPATPIWLQRVPGPARSEENCIRKEALACLFVDAGNLRAQKGYASETCIAILEKESLLPTASTWQGNACASLEDFAIAAVGLLALDVVDSANGLACMQALRLHGLPVDTDLPEWPADSPAPLLIEEEVRSFLARGLAAPLPSSLPVMPY